MSDPSSTDPRSARLPPLLVLTDRSMLPDGRSLVDQVRGCLEGGARAVVLREKSLRRDPRRALALEIKSLLDDVEGLLIVASDFPLARQVGAAGVHLAETDKLRGRDARVTWRSFSDMIGASYHRVNTLWQPFDFGFRYVTLSPIFPTASKPGYGPPLGLDTLRATAHDFAAANHGEAQRNRVDLFALGGIDSPERAADCFAAGADGVAVMGALMRANDPAATTAALLAAASKESV